MNRRDLIRYVAQTTELPQADAKAAVDAALAHLIEALVSGDEVRLQGFGTFAVRDRAERVLHGPIGQGRVMPAHRTAVFRPYRELKERLS